MISIVIPAHDESAVIGRLLTRLTGDRAASDLDVVVVCNGCTDDTPEIARRHGPQVRVLELTEPSKALALRAGDAEARAFPRIYLDADVSIGADDVRALARALTAPGVLAAAPRRVSPRRGVSWAVGSYYEVWERLPQVRDGLFGRGVVAVNADGHQRISHLPPVMSDDLALSEAFAPHERAIVDGATVTLSLPRNVRDLLRRRVRVINGNLEADGLGLRSVGSRTTLTGLGTLGLREPRVAARLPVFLGVTLAARVLAAQRRRAGRGGEWLRDESSRTAQDDATH